MQFENLSITDLKKCKFVINTDNKELPDAVQNVYFEDQYYDMLRIDKFKVGQDYKNINFEVPVVDKLEQFRLTL